MIHIPIGRKKAIMLVPELANVPFKKAVLVKGVKPLRYADEEIKIFPCGDSSVVVVYFDRNKNYRRFAKTKLLLALLAGQHFEIRLGR